MLALHVHHGLSEHADRWLAHCARRCRRWAAAGRPIAFASERLSERPARGESVEAWARKARYGALARLARAHGATLVLLAHHRRDQAETFLLQALRGGGVAGLAAMPRVAERAGLTWARPWLAEPRERIEAYGRMHRLRDIDDDSNADPRYARNRIRRDVWPALTRAFPDAETAMAAAAAQMQEALLLQQEWAAIDRRAVMADDGLELTAWQALPPGRRRAALRAWLGARLAHGVPGRLVSRLFAEAGLRNGRWWQAPGGEVHERGGRLVFVEAR